jgi:hypothetical protein
MTHRRTPDARPGVARTCTCTGKPETSWASLGLGCPRHEKAFLHRDMEVQAEEQDDLHQHLLYIEVANRALRAALKAHSPNRAKAWQTQVALVTHSDYEPRVREPRWGVIATVMIWQPKEGSDFCAAKKWAPTWREAIELAVAETLEI